MAPNTVSLHEPPVEEEAAKGRTKEIYLNGYYYDVTEFMRRHPGGSVIQFYTEPGEDASIAFEQFHFRSKKKVHAILNSLPKRAAPLAEVFRDPRTLTRNQAINKDFKELTEQLVTEGLFEPSIRQVILRLVEPIGLFLLVMGYAALDDLSWSGYLASTLAAGFAISRFAYLSHEGGHRSLTGSPKGDQFIQDICHSFFCGGSAIWWNSQHNRHHAMPQRLQHDVDLASLPFVVFNEREVTPKSKVNSFFVKYQSFMYFTLDLFLVSMAWKFYIFPRCQLRKRAWREIALNSLSFYMIYYYGFLWYFLMAYWFSFFLAVNFSLSHSHLEVADEPTHWIEYSLTHSANISPSKFMDYWMGYLNFQVEHHLYPTIPNFRLHLISSRVEALAKKHGLTYQVYGYWEATKLTMANLHRTGHSVVKNREESLKSGK